MLGEYASMDATSCTVPYKMQEFDGIIGNVLTSLRK
jgi:hypothetical protein